MRSSLNFPEDDLELADEIQIEYVAQRIGPLDQVQEFDSFTFNDVKGTQCLGKVCISYS
jgi:hypothetical protein